MRMKGVSFGFMARNGYYGSHAGQEEIQKVIASGATHVALMATIMQDAFYSTRVYRDFEFTPSDDELLETVRTFHAAGVKIMLKPIVEHHDSTHRGETNFPENQEQISGIMTDYWGEWFRNYTMAMRHYARIAEQEQVEMLCLGCEMTGADRREQYWPELIGSVRKIYRGKLTYNTPSWGDYDIRQHYMRDWYQLLDCLGISFYWGLRGKENPTVEEIAEAMRGPARNLNEAYEILGKPIFMAECGCRSVQNACFCPCDAWKNKGSYDGKAQDNWLKGVIRAFENYDWWDGLYWWKWDEQQERAHYHQPGGDTGFTIYGKPAAETFRMWCAGKTLE